MRTAAHRSTRSALLCASFLLVACTPGADTAPAASSTSSSDRPATSAERPQPTPEEEQVAGALADLEARDRVDQLFLVGVPLDDLASGDALAADGVGGLFLAGRSEAPATELAATTGRWQSLSPGPGLWVAADQEGGAVQTLRGPGFTRLPPAARAGRAAAGRAGRARRGHGRRAGHRRREPRPRPGRRRRPGRHRGTATSRSARSTASTAAPAPR